VNALLGDNGFYSQANVIACVQARVEPLLALKRRSHHESAAPSNPHRSGSSPAY
jgi:hypothetical protein